MPESPGRAGNTEVRSIQCRLRRMASGIQLGMTFLDGGSVRAPQKAAGTRRQGALKLNETIVRRLVALVAAMAPRLA